MEDEEEEEAAVAAEGGSWSGGKSNKPRKEEDNEEVEEMRCRAKGRESEGEEPATEREGNDEGEEEGEEEKVRVAPAFGGLGLEGEGWGGFGGERTITENTVNRRRTKGESLWSEEDERKQGSIEERSTKKWRREGEKKGVRMDEERGKGRRGKPFGGTD